MSLLLIRQEYVTPFKFWMEEIQEGIIIEGEIYALMRTYTCYERIQAYQDAKAFIQKGFKACLSRSEQEYSLWISMRTTPESSELWPPIYCVIYYSVDSRTLNSALARD